MCLQETTSSCGSKRRKTKGGEKRGGRGEERGAERQHSPHIGGSDKDLGERGGKKKKGFEVWTSKRLHALFPKNNVGLKQMRSLRCPNKVQNKTKGKERASAAAASTETLEGNNKERRQRHCCPADGPPFGFSSSLWSGEEAFGCWYSTSVKGTTHRIKPDDCRGELRRCHIH